MTEQGEVEVITSTEEPKGTNVWLIVLIIVLVMVFVCCACILLFYFWLGDLILNFLAIFSISLSCISNRTIDTEDQTIYALILISDIC